MKKFLCLVAALAVLAGAASCNTDIDQTGPQPSYEYRQVTITAGASQTKTSVSGGNLTWSTNDKLNIVPQSGTVAAAALDIKSGVGEASGTFTGQIDASITDNTDLYGWCGGSWTYSSGSFSVDMPATQTYVENGLAENAYPSIGTGSITNGISLSNPMGVLKLTVKGAVSDSVKTITITSAANNIAGSFTVDKSTYAISGGSSKTLTLNVASPYVALSSTGVNFYVVVPPAEYAANDLTVKITFSDDSYLRDTLSSVVTVTAGSATAKEICDYTGRTGTLKGQSWVIIKAKYDGTNDSYLKWATQNLAVTTSGKTKWNGTDYIIGDFFQWAASYDGYGLDGTTGKERVFTNLVVYDSFTNDGSTGSFIMKSGKGFNIASAPYGGNTFSTKYTKTDGNITLERSDDVASIVLGGTWRMPIGKNNGEFAALRAVTYWAWDATDKGYYVFKPGVGTSGAANARGTIAGTDDKTKALLFFPVSGIGIDSGFGNNTVGQYNSCWTSTFYPYTGDNTNRWVYRMDINHAQIDHGEGATYRDRGLSVRPVSD